MALDPRLIPLRNLVVRRVVENLLAKIARAEADAVETAATKPVVEVTPNPPPDVACPLKTKMAQA